jgi:hypothetical protein
MSFFLVTEYGTNELSVIKIDAVIVKMIVRLEQQRNPKC